MAFLFSATQPDRALATGIASDEKSRKSFAIHKTGLSIRSESMYNGKSNMRDYFLDHVCEQRQCFIQAQRIAQLLRDVKHTCASFRAAPIVRENPMGAVRCLLPSFSKKTAAAPLRVPL